MEYLELVKKAIEAKKFSYAPYSNFHVGAALLTKNDKVFTGCNIENAAFTPSNCAERTAFFKAISEGEKDFVAIAIIGDKPFTAPCGVCRQVMMEFCDDQEFDVILIGPDNQYKVHKLAEFFPFSFSAKELD